MSTKQRRTSTKLTSPIRDLDEVDRALLRALWEDPQMPNTQLARRVGVAELTVASRLDALIRDKLIRISVQREMRTLGFDMFGLVEIWVDRRDVYEVGELIGALPQVYSVVVLIGHPQLMIMVMARDMKEFSQLIEYEIATIPGVAKTVTSICLDVVTFRPGIASLQ